MATDQADATFHSPQQKRNYKTTSGSLRENLPSLNQFQAFRSGRGVWILVACLDNGDTRFGGARKRCLMPARHVLSLRGVVPPHY